MQDLVFRRTFIGIDSTDFEILKKPCNFKKKKKKRDKRAYELLRDLVKSQVLVPKSGRGMGLCAVTTPR